MNYCLDFLKFRQQKKTLDRINYIWSKAYVVLQQTDISHIDYQLEYDKQTLPSLINSTNDYTKVLTFLNDLNFRLSEAKYTIETKTEELYNAKEESDICKYWPSVIDNLTTEIDDATQELLYIEALTDDIDNLFELLHLLDCTQLSVFLNKINLLIAALQDFCTLLKQVVTIVISVTSITSKQLHRLFIFIPTFFIRILTTTKALQSF